MPLNFPTAPTLNQTYTEGTKTWVWNGNAWALSSTLASLAVSGNVQLGTTSTNYSNLTVYHTTVSTNTNSGALQVDGGVGINGNLNVGTAGAVSGAFHTFAGNITQTSSGGAVYFNTTGNISAAVVNVGILNSTGNILGTGAVLNALTVNGNITVASAYVVASANAASSLGSSATRWNFVYGVTGNFLSINANYADLAEKYLADAEYEPGTVLMFGGEQEVTECTHDMCSRVAGVVSTNPAYLMNSGLEGEHTVELALTGRVLTRVRGPIRKGDLMVSAGDGHARAENLPRVGTVIGKALEDFTGDTGVIEIVVGKH